MISLPQIVRRVEVPHRVQVSGRPAGSKPWISRSMWLVPRKVLNTSAIADVSVQCARGVFWVVGRGQERPPACLLDGSRVTVVVAGTGRSRRL